MFEDLLKDALKNGLENGIFVIVLVWFGWNQMVRQDAILKQNEMKAQQLQKTALETIEKIARQRDRYHDQLINCMQDRIRDNNKKYDD